MKCYLIFFRKLANDKFNAQKIVFDHHFYQHPKTSFYQNKNIKRRFEANHKAFTVLLCTQKCSVLRLQNL